MKRVVLTASNSSFTFFDSVQLWTYQTYILLICPESSPSRIRLACDRIASGSDSIGMVSNHAIAVFKSLALLAGAMDFFDLDTYAWIITATPSSSSIKIRSFFLSLLPSTSY